MMPALMKTDCLGLPSLGQSCFVLGALLCSMGCTTTPPVVEPVQAVPCESSRRKSEDSTPTELAKTPPVPSNAPRPFGLKGTEVLALSSQQTGRDYELAIRLPVSFKTDQAKTYPVLYLLDAQWNFELLNRITSSLEYDQVIPETLVVGITYAGEEPDYGALRMQDFLPTEATAFDGQVGGGEARQFLTFLEESVIPFVEGRYRVDTTHRILSGASYGGLFVLYALFEKPGLFSGYFSMSPAVNWDSAWIFKREEAFRAQHAQLDTKLWLSVGSVEWDGYVASNRAFFTQVKASKYNELLLTTRVIEGERHAGNLPEAHTRSLRFYFDDWLKAQSAETKK